MLSSEGFKDPQMQTVCVLLQEKNHTFLLCFTFFICSFIHYNHLSLNHFIITFNNLQ